MDEEDEKFYEKIWFYIVVAVGVVLCLCFCFLIVRSHSDGSGVSIQRPGKLTVDRLALSGLSVACLREPPARKRAATNSIEASCSLASGPSPPLPPDASRKTPLSPNRANNPETTSSHALSVAGKHAESSDAEDGDSKTSPPVGRPHSYSANRSKANEGHSEGVEIEEGGGSRTAAGSPNADPLSQGTKTDFA